MTESMLETSSQPGLILKTAREEMSLSIEQVAQELHLRPTVVKALEEEKYSEFSSDVFLKGYFRTYCRLVKLHEDRMIELLEKQLNALKEQTDKSQEKVVKAQQSKKRRKKIITFCIFLVCASLVYVVYLLSTQSGNFISESASPDNTQNEKVENTYASVNTVSPETSAPEAENESIESLAENASNHADNFPETMDQAELKSLDSAEETDNNTAPVSPISANVNETMPSEIVQAETEGAEILESRESSALANLNAVFSGDCWFKLTDGTGKTVMADLKRANDQINYQGQAPFHIVIGDASKVSLSFNGKSVDLTQYGSRNGRAEIHLKTDAQARGE